MRPYPALLKQAKSLTIRKDESIFYYDSGADAKPPVILIHGLGDEADSWRRLIPLLDNTCRTLALDLPGFGRSKSGGMITIGRHIKAVVSLLEMSGPAALAGSSLGGVIAQAVAAAKPELAKALILIDGGAPLTNAPGGALNMLGKALPFYGTHWYRAFRKNHAAAYRSLFGYYHNFEELPEEDRSFLYQRVIERVESAEQERAYFGTLRSMIWYTMTRTASLAKALADYKGSVAFVWGENDKILPPKTADSIRSIRPEAPFVLIPNAGHLPHQEHPEAVAAVIAKTAVA
ncbi:MAG: alpha/beta hydrolase [Treponema sp.]|nr:alpha/beta hydrolase [Treponema sp.]